MTISYEIILTIVNLTNDNTETFVKDFDFNIDGLSDTELYNNYHSIADKVQMFTLFKNEINQYCENNDITVNNIDIDEFNINSNTDRVDVYFEPGDGDDPNQISLNPNIRCYVYPKYDALEPTALNGVAYDHNTIIWSWEDDGQAHYLISEPIDVTDEDQQDKIIAQIPIGTNTYTETNLEPDTLYTRRLITYNSEQTSRPSAAKTIQTATAPIDQSLDQYKIDKNYDYTSDDSERVIIQENLEAFHSGIGDYNDLKVYKQMDSDFYQKFKTYIQLRGSRTQKEKRYDSVGFNYKVCLESMETVEEQKGEVTFDIDVFPRENITIKDYMYATQEVTVCARMRCDVLLKKPEDNSEDIECPLKEPEWEKKYKDVPNDVIKEEDHLAFNPVSIIFIVDVTKSSQHNSGYETQGMYDALGKSGVPFIQDQISRIVAQIESVKGDGVIDYTLIAFDEISWVVGPTNVDGVTFLSQCIPYLDYRALTCTEWTCGLNLAQQYLVQEHSAVFFFSDGGANTTSGTLAGTMFDGATDYSVGIINYIQSAGNELKNRTDYILACVYALNQNIVSGRPNQTFTSGYMQTIASCVGDEVLSWTDASSLSAAFTTFLERLTELTQGDEHFVDPDGNITDEPTHKEIEGWEFKGWKDCGDKITLTANWDIDNCKWARIYYPPLNEQPWTVTIDDTLTPVVYARNEQRAIIPSDSIIVDRNFDPDVYIRQEAIKVENRNLQDIILEAVQQTAAYQAGYTELVEAYTDAEKKQGNYIIRGLIIKDTYKYADEDTVPDVNFTDDDLEDGYVGTINVYADINKLNTGSYGDDIYAVGQDKYVWLSGYTDAIIYDGERIQSFELNASHAEPSDHQEEIIFATDGDYRQYLKNRKNKTLTYSGSKDVIRHVADMVEKDEHIYLTGSNTLKQIKDWTVFVPPGTDISDLDKIVRGTAYPSVEYLNTNIVAHNDEHYQSPILNYRFNYEDPDAYTSYYELLPDCDPFSPYKNIVFVHIYYAKNIYIQDQEQLSGSSTVYISQFGTDNIATRASNYWQNNTKILGQTYFREDYIDDYLWFQAKPMYETRPYYDEKPNAGMDSFYGNVNGRYKDSNKSGKQDLRVVTPQFNLPTTIDTNNIKIYIMITEFYPNTALVSYQWEHPSVQKDSITNVNGDYVTFSSDSLTYKDVVYNELIQTVTSKSMELFDNKTTMEYFELTKPLSKFPYDHYYIELFSDNSDVLALNYPSEIVFDENNRAEFGANFKGVVNATTKWSPRIHNGYYYLNQHEYYAYSEFDIEADFEEYNEENYKTISGYLTIDVELLRKAGPSEHYDILKNTRAELMQNEKEFIWVDSKGLTIVPQIDGEYYKEYSAHVYTSPVILFPNALTSAGRLRVDYYFEDGSDALPMQVRSYNILDGQWSDWTEFTNDSVPNVPLSCAYQVQFTLAASVTHQDKQIEDYLCCYLDWVDDGDTPNHVNCVTITDHLQAGPYKSEGIFNSKILDYGCESTITIDMFASNINNECALYVASESYNKDKLLLENAKWVRVNGSITMTSRFFRYRIVIPYGEKVYWIHKNIVTKETEALLPIVTQIQMTGDYQPLDTYDSFQEIQSFEIVTDGMSHRIFPSVYDIISGDIANKGFRANEIQYVRINSTENNIHLEFDNGINSQYPSLSVLNTAIYATADFETEMSIKYTPYIYASIDPNKELDVLKILRGTPQQYCPITMEDADGTSYREVFDVDPDTLKKTEEFIISNEDDQHYIKLSRNDFDIKTLVIYLNDEVFEDYRLVNNLIIFNRMPSISDKIKIVYNILNSFYTEIDYDNDKTQMTIYSDYDTEVAKREEINNLVPIVEHTTYTEFPMNQIYANGIKNYIYGTATEQDTNWKYDANANAIYYLYNRDEFSMIINDLTPSTSYELSIISYSEDSDGDIIGIVVGYLKDSGGTVHTISYLVSLSTDFLFNNHNTALVLDYGRSGYIVLASKDIDHTGYVTWDQLTNGIKFFVKKTDTEIIAKISDWNDPDNWNDNSQLTVNLTDETLSPILELFTRAVSYGLCVQSQRQTYFVSPQFAGRVDRTITVEEQITKLKHKYKVYFETNKTNNKFIATDLSLNPVYRTDYKGFIYLTDEHNEPYVINIYRNPKYIKAGGYDKIDVAIECLDYEGNPVISKDIEIDCNYGILNFDNTDAKHLTDINGVIHVLYESAVLPCDDILKARTVATDGTVIEASVEIINE